MGLHLRCCGKGLGWADTGCRTSGATYKRNRRCTSRRLEASRLSPEPGPSMRGVESRVKTAAWHETLRTIHQVNRYVNATGRILGIWAVAAVGLGRTSLHVLLIGIRLCDVLQIHIMRNPISIEFWFSRQPAAIHTVIP
ncbi:hypothetical protein NEOLEDRAFT_672067 [Neolentinus lepideus HHB14362 ss-1]|uniref:Uncharacterized protein n=1 Tax=Neolentinus lepideus HHB14362 ss-1 TaxID=1314782 RepID=A0A165QBJ3_9AGAM|nr:hypothetical protein NEOLEDRAFT_672067 [Neolentinus lepideus HHB14362 ss-1]